MAKADKRERQRENRERARAERERLMKRDKRMRALRSLLIVLVPVMVILVIVSITNSDDDTESKAETIQRTFKAAPPMTIDASKTYTATMRTSEGTITLALDPVKAPIATNNFVFLARKRFYDGLTIHRAAKDFVIQGGDPKGDGSGGPGYTVAGEVPTDNYPVGSLAAAKGGADPAGTFGSQFFIVTGAQGATLPNDYARFGTVTAGLDVAQAIEKFAPESGDGTPKKQVKIISVRIRESAADSTTSSTVATDSTSSSSSTSSTTGG